MIESSPDLSAHDLQSKPPAWFHPLPRTPARTRVRAREPTLSANPAPAAMLTHVWRQLPTWRQEAMWCRRMWRQNVALLAHVVSGSQLASPDAMWRQNVASLAHVSGSQVASPDVASKHGSCFRWCRWSCARVHAMASAGVTRRGVRTWRHLFRWRQRATWRRRTWRQNVASGAIDLRDVVGRGVNTWCQGAQASRHVSSNVSSVVGRYVHPHRRPS